MILDFKIGCLISSTGIYFANPMKGTNYLRYVGLIELVFKKGKGFSWILYCVDLLKEG